MEIIKKEEYEKAKENVGLMLDWMARSKNRILELVDELTDEKSNYEHYKHTLETNKLIILTYEAQQEVKGEK